MGGEAIWKALNSMPLHACNCRGPQNGDPVCPCAMRGVQIINGRYVRTEDLGPAPIAKQLGKLILPRRDMKAMG